VLPVGWPSKMIRMNLNRANFYHCLESTTPKWFSGQNNSIGVLEGLDSIYIVHRSITKQCCPSRSPQKSFTIFSRYTTPKWLPSQTNELKVFERFESTYFYEAHAMHWLPYAIESYNNHKCVLVPSLWGHEIDFRVQPMI